MRKVILLVLALGSLCAFAVPLRAVFAQDDAGTILAQINGLRASKGLPPLSMNGALTAAATAHSTYLANNRRTDPHVEANGSTPHSRITAAGYGGSYVGENVYGGSMATAAIAWNYWLNSPVHYTGMTNPGFSEIGIGVVRGPFGTFYTTDFGGGGSPVAAAPAGVEDSPAPINPANVVNSGPPAPTKTRARPLPSAIPTNTPGPSAPPTLTFTPVPSKTHAPDEPDAPTATAFIFDLAPQADTPLAVAALPTATGEQASQAVTPAQNTDLPTPTPTLQAIAVLPTPSARIDNLPRRAADDTQNGFASAIIPVALLLQGVVLGGFLLRRRR